jgi:hypothetical protein
MMKGLNDVAKKLGKPPIAQADMDLIMWKNTARLWKIDTSKLPLAKGKRK